MKKLVSLLLCGMLLLSCIPALALEFNPQTETPICKEKVTLTLAVPDNVKIVDYATNLQTKMMEQRMGVEMQFQVYASNDYTTKLNLMVMGGDTLPDILIGGGFTDAMVYAWAQEGALLPLTEYFNDPEISYYLHDARERLGTNFFSQLTMPDGEIYAIPALNQSYSNEYPDKLFLYKPWLDQLGMEVPKTTDDLYTLLKAVTTTDLNGNGIADEVGLTGEELKQWFSYLMNAFVYADDGSNYLAVEDGKLYFAYTTDAWKEGLKYIRKLIAEGCIPVETLTQDNTQWKSMINTDTPTVFGMVYISGGQVTQLYADGTKRRNDYMDVPPLTGPHGVKQATFNESACSPAFLITADCKNPEAAFRLGDLMVSPYYSVMTRWGEEGVDWDYLDKAQDWENYTVDVEGAMPSFAEYATFFWDQPQQNKAWLQTGPYIREFGLANGRVKYAMPKGQVEPCLYANCNKHYQEGGWAPKETFPKLLYTVDESNRAADIMATLKTYVTEKTAAFLSGSLDIDASWDMYLAELDAIGINTALEVNQAVYDRMYK